MTDVFASKIFFTVTTISVIAVTIFILVALFYIIRILKDAHELSHRARIEGEAVLAGVGFFRKSAVKLVHGLFGKKKTRSQKKLR